MAVHQMIRRDNLLDVNELMARSVLRCIKNYHNEDITDRLNPEDPDIEKLRVHFSGRYLVNRSLTPLKLLR